VFEENKAQNEAGLPRDMYALLAQANLLRMRGCWEDAVDRCMAALRLSPDSPSALSLLGDIYENQGRYDDAAQWYRMALDVNPNSPADQMKLELLLRLRQEPRELRSPAASEDSAVEKPVRLPQLLRSPEMALRFGAVTAALLLIFVVGLAYASTHRHAGLASLGLVPDQEVRLQPVVVLPASAAASNAAALHNPAEQMLLDALRGSPDLGAQGITVYDVQSDPRTGRIDLTFGVSSSSGGMTRALVMQMAVRLLQTAAALPATQTINLFTARCLGEAGSGSGGAALIFVGDMPRASIPAPNAVLTDAQIQTLFSNLWWSPQIPT